MATDKQTAANRINARKSTGPRSAAGKMKSALNARKHGFAGSIFTVVRLEDLNEIDQLRQDALDLYRPVNSQELFAVERIAVCQLSMIRASRLEAGLFTTCLDKALDPEGEPIHLMSPELAGNGDIEITRLQNRNFVLGEGFHRSTQKPHTWALFLRYQAQAERLYRRAIQEFERLRALRSDFEEEELPEIPNEPNSPSQPQANQPDPVPVGQAPLPSRDPLVALPGGATSPAPQTNPIPPTGRFDPAAFLTIMNRPIMESDGLPYPPPQSTGPGEKR
ncbi:MAG: hypothetical protein ABSB88_03705 [Bryobacteraceae bacterium]|jgi:hypothetical protein